MDGYARELRGFWERFSLSSTVPSNASMYDPEFRPIKHR